MFCQYEYFPFLSKFVILIISKYQAMKTNLKLVTVLVLTLIFSATAVAQNNSNLRIVRGKADTVFTPSHFITGVSVPGSAIYINDQTVKQYSTGSFGTELTLNEGDNQIIVRSVNGTTEELIKFTVHYKKAAPQQRTEAVPDYPNPVVRTKKGAYLNYGAGEDRLGGAKINFLAEGIKLELLDSVNNLYKVKLSESRYAFIPKQFTERLPLGSMPPFSLTSSWSVTNSGKADRIRIALQDRQPYIIYRESDPNRLMVEIHGAACNSNWITQYLDLKAVDYVHFRQISPDIFTAIIYLKDKYSWGYSVDYVGNSLDITIRHTPQPTLKGMVIGVDAGHGGSATGAVSTAGYREKDFNLNMAYILKEELEKRGASVVMSRSEDIDVSMQERTNIFKEANVDLVVSVHCNAGGHPLREMGTSTYYRHIEYRPLAETILKRLLELDVKNFGLIGNFNFSLNAPTEFPSVLVEALFMSSLPEEELLANPKFQKDMMLKVVKGLEDYLSAVKKSLK